MKKAILFIAAVTVGLSFTPLPATASSSIFMYVEGIPGEATHVDHKDWINVLMFSEGISKRGIANDNAMNRMVITKPLDRSSPLLRLSRYTGGILDEAIIEMWTPGLGAACYLEILLEQVRVESITCEMESASEDGRPLENIALRFKYIRMTYKLFDLGDGSFKENIIMEHTFP